ncbi:unnamed protein product [Soboliphyme baturini]|uniref:non-specific serine/threonine protein kinase n=1 Tax=Soboliphyme baturini TaxID=241478 RepID=A0A183J5F5_9BILA|nr:unnamed protein product [Soboliphyme baturini]
MAPVRKQPMRSQSKTILRTIRHGQKTRPIIAALKAGADNATEGPWLLSVGTILNNSWQVRNALAHGSFGQVFVGVNLFTGCKVAIKAEPSTSSAFTLRTEVLILQKLKGKPHMPEYYGYGCTASVFYVVMQLLGRNLSELKKTTSLDMFSAATTFRLGMQMLESIEQLHDIGYLHRDIKPGNFVIGKRANGQHKVVYLIDFGLARQYVDPVTGSIKPPRTNCGFRGTMRYASVNSHKGRDLCRADDLWSLFYSMLEMIRGQLPWRKIHDRQALLVAKQETDFYSILEAYPPELHRMFNHLHSLNYYCRPNYSMLSKAFRARLASYKVRDSTPFEWEHPDVDEDEIMSLTDNNGDC